MDEQLYDIEDLILHRAEGRFVNVDQQKKFDLITTLAKSLDPNISKESIQAIVQDMDNLDPLGELLTNEEIEDIMVNNTENVYVYHSKGGYQNTGLKVETAEKLNRLVLKLRLYATNETSKGNIMDVHLPTKSRVNIVSSPKGYDITIRNFKKIPLSMIDLINRNMFNYKIAARLWLYIDGFNVRPANLLIGGIPGTGKSTLLNAFFSFFRPNERIVTIEETYELDTTTQENCVNLETSLDVPLEALVKNALRMRPEMLIIGEVRGAEANDMIAAMNVGKIGLSTIHASSTRDIINRLIRAPMNVPKETISVIDALIVLSTVHENKIPVRKIVQISEVAGLETNVLLSDLYKFDYKTHSDSEILSSVTYRDNLATLLGINPADVIAEEKVRAQILERLNKIGKRDIRSIGETVRDYYDNPEDTLKRIGLPALSPAVTV
jgi:archaeal flagellar protein FlaI